MIILVFVRKEAQLYRVRVTKMGLNKLELD